MKVAIAIVLMIVLVAVIFFGEAIYISHKAAADEQIRYTVRVMEKNEYGYVPMNKFEIPKSVFESTIQMCPVNYSWLSNGDLLIRIGTEVDNIWFVKIAGDDPEIQTICEIKNEFGTECPARD